MRLFTLLLLAGLGACQQEPPPLPPAQLQQIAALIYRNECASRPQALTSWNRGEVFASLGIGHFIWYPHGVPPEQKHFHESFPEMLAFLQHHGVQLPRWLARAEGAPWPNRMRFLQAQDSAQMRALRQLLQTTMPLQARFMQQRMRHALAAIQAGLPAAEQAHIRRQFARVAAAPMGYYALIDYVNFKGEGTSTKERYQGKGWGLRQVLLTMQGDESGLAAIRAFANAAGQLLAQRVRLSPPARQEQRWLPGWQKRLRTYVSEAAAIKASTPASPMPG